MLTPIILSGGSGTRLWPVSRKNLPKQFLALAGEDTLFQQTVARAMALPGVSAPIIVAADDHRFLVAEQLAQMNAGGAGIILEPVARNTAPAIAAGAVHALVLHPDTLLLVLPADHLIADVEAFQNAVESAVPLAREGWLVTFGITPERAETGFGYVHRSDPLSPSSFKVDRFVEKPDAATAEEYFQDGKYDWNSGMFLFKASRYLEELSRFEPEIASAARKAYDLATRDLDFIRLDAEAFARSPSNSIDYAVMEHTSTAAVVPVTCGWNDVGSWLALWKASIHDERDNSTEGDTILINTSGSLLRSHDRHVIAAVGLENVIVVTTPDATLVANMESSQDVKHVVERLRASDRVEHELHRVVLRPWGSYDSLEAGPRFQVKRIIVKPGAALSLQRHKHRAEHWIVVSGQAEVTCDDRVFLLNENESTYIPQGSVHRLRNPGEQLLELIEVQSGSYLGEDDIERLDDVYGRA
jgi:mannose-1-phosphate guanylyltransferase/mannose-6-phosphate isomerase